MWCGAATVANLSQGEVISFAASCADAMRAAGCNVLMEGRAPTLAYVRTPHRFELTLSKPLLIGSRRAAQRIVAKARAALQGVAAEAADEAAVKGALSAALDDLVAGK